MIRRDSKNPCTDCAGPGGGADPMGATPGPGGLGSMASREASMSMECSSCTSANECFGTSAESIGSSKGSGDVSTEIVQLADKEDIEILNTYIEVDEVSKNKEMDVYIEDEILERLNPDTTLIIGAFEDYSPGRRKPAELTLTRR